ncbi:hypothetical protein HDV06_002026 [Boothiomyces sp. JEL0866]|nr:hypothetical protein HDV06_002026 [Boothiomyces sp. JEL0866]
MQITTSVNFEEWFGLLDTYPYPTPTMCEFQTDTICTTKSECSPDLGTAKNQTDFSQQEILTRKRQKQNEAARRCRLKKANQLLEFKDLVCKLQNQLFEKDIRLTILEKEQNEWQKREEEYKRQIELLKKERDDYFTIANIHCAK